MYVCESDMFSSDITSIIVSEVCELLSMQTGTIIPVNSWMWF